MNDNGLSPRCLVVGYQSAVLWDVPSVYPRAEYLVGRIVVVVLNIVYDKEFLSRKAPDIPCPTGGRFGLVDLVNLPVVSLG